MERGLDQEMSGVVTGIVASILGVGAFFLFLGGWKSGDGGVWPVIPLIIGYFAGRAGSIAFGFYALPVSLLAGLFTRWIWWLTEGRSQGRLEGKDAAPVMRAGLWDRELDGR
jgi:hypothetical protein